MRDTAVPCEGFSLGLVWGRGFAVTFVVQRLTNLLILRRHEFPLLSLWSSLWSSLGFS